MQLGLIGLGRMGGNIARRLMQNKHEIVAFDHNPKTIAALDGATGVQSLKELVSKLKPPRAVWVMVPAGAPTESTVQALGGLLDAGDTVLDGGNSFFKDDVRRAQMMAQRGIDYVDVGTSGGVWGFERGYCMMIGGKKEVVQRLDPIFAALAPGEGSIPKTPHREGRDPRVEKGYLHAGPVGAGHFVKMVHNGIEYGLMQAYAEGFDILRGRNGAELPDAERFDIDLADVAEVWRRGSVISSWLLDLTAMALAETPTLEEYEGKVDDSGEGRWTVNAAIDEAVAAPVITAALYARFRSRISHSFGEKVLSAMRNKFGGHVEGALEAHHIKETAKKHGPQ
jgi:6-phosphogluconate dehydrogenase